MAKQKTGSGSRNAERNFILAVQKNNCCRAEIPPINKCGLIPLSFRFKADKHISVGEFWVNVKGRRRTPGQYRNSVMSFAAAKTEINEENVTSSMFWTKAIKSSLLMAILLSKAWQVLRASNLVYVIFWNALISNLTLAEN